jgi:hypothetical protein
MPWIAIVYGLALIAVGVVGYVASGGASVTALIPSFLGAPVVVLGALALKERFLKHAMHGAAAVALLGALGSFRGLVQAATWIAGSAPERPGATLAQALTALLSIVFLVLAVRSFVKARRSAAASSAAGS